SAPRSSTLLPESAAALSLTSRALSTSESSTLSLHDALPISYLEGPVREHDEGAEDVGERILGREGDRKAADAQTTEETGDRVAQDRKSTRLNSSHVKISYAVFCLKKKKIQKNIKKY